MDQVIIQQMADQAIEHFDLPGTMIDRYTYGSGHINDTYLLLMEQKDGHIIKYILQRMNHDIFKSPEQLMENILGVTSHLRKKIIENGGDPERETLNVVRTHEGMPYHKDEQGLYWRVYTFIDGATSYDKVEKPDDFYQSAVTFGNFQRLLSDYPAETLHETIVGFHDTAARYKVFQQAVRDDIYHRAGAVQKEIEFVMAHEETAHVLGSMLAEGKLPLRVTHNDTKLNNIMIDNKTGRGICVIDLDTVMPGLSINDYGDSIRFGASTGDEDEPDLSRVWCDLNLFKYFTRGFIEGCHGSLTENELRMLPMGAKVMTFECGMRFLTDYLQGDTYFKIHREGHNLDRCRTQFKLVADMEDKWAQMAAIVEKYAAGV